MPNLLQSVDYGKSEEIAATGMEEGMCNCDKHTVYDWVLAGCAGALTSLLLAANAGIARHARRNRYVVAVGGADLIVATSAAGVLWMAVSFVTNEHFNRHGLWANCSLWTFWLQLPLGGCLWISLLSLRLLRLYWLSKHGKWISSAKVWLCYVPLILAPSIVFSLLATLYRASQRKNMQCDVPERWRHAAYLSVPPFYMLMTFILLLCVRREKDFLVRSEHRHTCESAMMSFVVYLLDAVIFMAGKQRCIAGRCFLTFCTCSLVLMDFWVRLGKPAYLCIFKSAIERKIFEDELCWSGAKVLDKVTNSEVVHHNTNVSIPASQLHDGNQILRTMSIIMSEMTMHEERIRQLESRKSQLSQQIQESEASIGFLCSFQLEHVREHPL